MRARVNQCERSATRFRINDQFLFVSSFLNYNEQVSRQWKIVCVCLRRRERDRLCVSYAVIFGFKMSQRMQIDSINELNSFYFWLNAAFDALERENDGNTLDWGNAWNLKIHLKHEKKSLFEWGFHENDYVWVQASNVGSGLYLNFIVSNFIVIFWDFETEKRPVETFLMVNSIPSKAGLASICLLHAVRKKLPDFRALF